ncbi:MAG TPA: nuclear transport factor 2 family protein [Candidatus Binataceae bacterium]|nr:nuclear transport factor 2 family protein [Candidatus Binataceae bacterium]
MKSVEQIVTELQDREAIRELPVRYCDCVWRGDIDGIVNLFSADATFIVKGPQREAVSKGHAELKTMYSGALGDVQPRPYIHNHVVELAGPARASGRCYVELRSFRRNMEWIGSGYYEDEYVKVGEQWKFGSRRFIRIGPDLGRAAAAAGSASRS